MRNLILKTVSADMTSHGGFVWPRSGHVEAPDWSPKPVCGGGLHGALHGCGDGSLFRWDYDAVWVVFEAMSEIIDLNGKVKCRSAEVIYAGTREEATNLILRECGPVQCIGVTVTGGYWATVTGGDWATVTGGDWATVTGGYGARVTGGDEATVTGGDEATLIVRWHDTSRRHVAVAYVGEDGIKADTPYRCVGGKFIEVTK